jgi:hypothetical protein
MLAGVAKPRRHDDQHPAASSGVQCLQFKAGSSHCHALRTGWRPACGWQYLLLHRHRWLVDFVWLVRAAPSLGWASRRALFFAF